MSFLNPCAVPTCGKDPNHVCFLLPEGQKRAKIWMKKCGIKTNYGNTMVCEAHFPKDMLTPTKRLKKGAVPSLNLPPLKWNPSTSQGNSIPKLAIPSNTVTTVKISNQVNNGNSIENIFEMPVNVPSCQSNLPTNIMPFVIEPIVVGSPSNSSPTNFKELASKIVKSHYASLSQSNLRTDIESIEVDSSSNSSSASGKGNMQDSGGRTVQATISQAVESSFSVNNKKEHTDDTDVQITRSEQALSSTQNELLADTNYVSRIALLQKKVQFLLKYPEILSMIAVKIYLKYPEGYKMLYRTLQLPPVPELKTILKDWTITTDDVTIFGSILQYKSKLMSLEQNDCIICIGTINVKKYINYDTKHDKLIGVFDINDIQKPEPAYKVLVLTVQGIYTEWKQPIDIAFLSSPKQDNVSANNIDKLIENNIRNLLKIGLKPRAIVCETDYLLQITSPHHKTYRKIYYMYDIMSLLKWFFYTLLTHDYIFEGERAKFEHIYDYFQLDSKNKPRLSPKITEEILKPASIQDVNANNVLNVINMETAAAMTVYINMKALKPATNDTVNMITKISTLYEVLWSNKCDNESKERYSQVLCEMTSFFDGLKIVNSLTQKEVAAEDTFVPRFQLTIKTLLMLSEDMQKDDDFKAFPTQRLMSLENMTSFFDRIKQLKKDDIKPTCKEVLGAFRQSALLNILKPTYSKNPVASLEDLLIEIKNIMDTTKLNQKINTLDILSIKCSEYNTLNFKNKDSIVLLAGFLLKKCYDRHPDCDDMKNYTFIVLQDTSSICKTILEEIQEGVCVVPQESFIEFVEMLEIRFRSLMTKEILESQYGFIGGLLRAMQSVTFPMPCTCFPLFYAKKLYLRVRIYDMLKFNNSYLTAFPEQCNNLVVNNL